MSETAMKTRLVKRVRTVTHVVKVPGLVDAIGDDGKPIVGEDGQTVQVPGMVDREVAQAEEYFEAEHVPLTAAEQRQRAADHAEHEASCAREREGAAVLALPIERRWDGLIRQIDVLAGEVRRLSERLDDIEKRLPRDDRR